MNRSWMRVPLGGAMALALLFSAPPAYAQQGTLSKLVVAGLTPAFSPSVRQYTVPKAANCTYPVTATLSNTANSLYVSNALTTSGTTRNAWACDAKTIDVVILSGWTEIGRYTITPVVQAPPPPPPPPPPALSGLVVAGLTPAFDPAVNNYTLVRTACSVSVTATLSTPTNNLYIQSGATASGVARSAWVCDGKTVIDIIVYKVWTEVGKYTITMVNPPPGMSPPPMSPPPATPPVTPPATEPVPQPSPAPTFADPMPAVSPVDAATAQRFLRQASFGPSSADMTAVKTSGPQMWLWQQFQAPASTYADGLDINAVRARVFVNMTHGPDQLRQRVMFALSQILVVSANKNVNGEEMIPWMRMLSTHAFGNYRTLLREVTLSPTMGKFLDLANSFGGGGNTAPNENYPRELMQLFSLGIWKLQPDGTLLLDAQGHAIPTYDQPQVREVARALTGWTYPTAPNAAYRGMNNEYFIGLMEARPSNHDKNAKTIFNVTIPAGQTVTKDMDDTLDAIFNHPNLPPFIATRLIRSLVTSNPTPAYIKRVADVFVNNGQGVRGDLAAVVKAVLLDPDAALPALTDGHLVDPIIQVTSLARALDAQVTDPGMFMYVLDNLGQMVLTPASVFSFYSPLAPLPGDPTRFGPEFMVYAPALAVQRANFTYGLLGNQFGGGFKVDLTPFTALAANPAALVELVNQKLLQGRMSDDLRAIILDATVQTTDPSQRALGALYLAAMSSEFLVHAGQ